MQFGTKRQFGTWQNSELEHHILSVHQGVKGKPGIGAWARKDLEEGIVMSVFGFRVSSTSQIANADPRAYSARKAIPGLGRALRGKMLLDAPCAELPGYPEYDVGCAPPGVDLADEMSSRRCQPNRAMIRLEQSRRTVIALQGSAAVLIVQTEQPHFSSGLPARQISGVSGITEFDIDLAEGPQAERSFDDTSSKARQLRSPSLVSELGAVKTTQGVVERADEALINAIAFQASQVRIGRRDLRSIRKLKSTHSQLKSSVVTLKRHERLPQRCGSHVPLSVYEEVVATVSQGSKRFRRDGIPGQIHKSRKGRLNVPVQSFLIAGKIQT
jgi:hypothetical protein